MSRQRRPTNPSDPAPTPLRPVEHLLAINEEIMEARERLRRSILLARLLFAGFAVATVVPVALATVTILTWRQFDMQNINFIGLMATVIGIVALSIALGNESRTRPWQARLQLQVLLEEKRVKAAELLVDPHFKRSSYKEELPESISDVRRQSRRYRTIHNSLQTVIIIGSLATSTATGISLANSDFRSIAAVVSFIVGISAGVSGYFKFRERGFYLQKFADSLEREYQALELGIGKYGNQPTAEALAVFVFEVERLRTEQQEREQNLDQPSERPSS